MGLKSGCTTMQGLKRGIVTTSDSLDVDGRDLELMTGEGAVVKEMEAAAVAWVCKQLGCPFVAIKAVTDIVDGEEATREEFESNLGQKTTSQKERHTTASTLCSHCRSLVGVLATLSNSSFGSHCVSMAQWRSEVSVGATSS